MCVSGLRPARPLFSLSQGWAFKYKEVAQKKERNQKKGNLATLSLDSTIDQLVHIHF